jgi:site-specific DNA-cytosine methylase
VLWHPAQIGEAGQETSGETEAGPGAGGWSTERTVTAAVTNHAGSGVDDNHAQAGYLLYKEVSNTITASLYHRGTVVNQDVDDGHLVVYKEISNCLSTRNQRVDYETETFVLQQYDGYNQKLEEDGTYRTLRTGKDSGDFVAVPADTTYRVRRLTPRECERLQGWPDDHTRWANTGKEVSDSARYKMCGNGVSAPVAQWIGENIMKGHTK